MIITRTPLRISLVGGGSDMPSYFNKRTGAVVSFVINKYIYISVNEKFDGAFRVSYSKTENVNSIKEIEHNLVRSVLNKYSALNTGLEVTSVADIPGGGSGLGSSSSFVVGLISAMECFLKNNNISHDDFTRNEFVNFAWKIEDSYTNVGKQDHAAAVFGGFNKFSFFGEKVVSEKINYSKFGDLHEHLLLLWTGKSRSANEILNEQGVFLQTQKGVEIGWHLASLAEHLYVDLNRGCSIKMIGDYLKENWKLKKKLSNKITSSDIDFHYNHALANGAYGGKLLGAGGGGFMFFIAPPDTHARIQEVTRLRKIPIAIEQEGSKVIYAD